MKPAPAGNAGNADCVTFTRRLPGDSMATSDTAHAASGAVGLLFGLEGRAQCRRMMHFNELIPVSSASGGGPILLNSRVPGWTAMPPPAACGISRSSQACGSPGHIPICRGIPS
jgi:hypothetical protein